MMIKKKTQIRRNLRLVLLSDEVRRGSRRVEVAGEAEHPNEFLDLIMCNFLMEEALKCLRFISDAVVVNHSSSLNQSRASSPPPSISCELFR